MLGILSSYEFLNYWSIWRLEFKGLGVNIYTVDISFSEMLIPRDILIPFEFECGKFDSRPGAGLVWAHARVADQWMDGAWTRGMPGMMVRWEDGGVGTHGVRTGPRPNNTRALSRPSAGTQWTSPVLWLWRRHCMTAMIALHCEWH